MLCRTKKERKKNWLNVSAALKVWFPKLKETQEVDPDDRTEPNGPTIIQTGNLIVDLR